MAVWSHTIHRPSAQWSNFDPAYLNIAAAGIRSVYLWSGSFISDKKPFSIGSDSICMKLPGNKVDCFKYGAKWNKYLLKEKFGLFVDFEFLTEMGSWGTA